jgi:acyl-coenzyme A thioesterase PaaI-like protein
MYAAVLGSIGDDPRALTTNVAINFLSRAPARDLVARCKILNSNADFVVGSIVVYPESDETNVICSSTCTYAIPPRAIEQS